MTVLDLFQFWLGLPWYHVLWLPLTLMVLK